MMRLRLLQFTRPFANVTPPGPAFDPTTTPTALNGKPLQSWQQVHDQFKVRLPRPGIDTDDRDIGPYPRVPSTPYSERDYRLPWDDKFNRRNLNEPVPEQFDLLNVFMIERGQYKMWYMVTSVGCFLGCFVVYFWVCDWYESKYGVPRGPHPFKSDPKYTIKTA